MASRSFAEEDFSCPVCCDIFINPVLLSCSHSFCSSCIQRVWENKTLKECPVCRKTSSNDHPPVNLALKNLCESFQQERQRSGPGVCSVHNETIKLFCLDDQQPVCVVCRDSRKHTDHRFCPVDEAVADKKEILKASLECLQEELITSVNREQKLCKTAEDIKVHAQDTETQIKDEFEGRRQLLHDEEAARITALREEEEKRSQRMKEKMKNTSKQISSLTITIRDIEEQMKAEDVSFLQNFEATLQRAQYIPDPDPSPSVPITFTDHLTNLKPSVSQKMQDNVGKPSDFNIESKQEKKISPGFQFGPGKQGQGKEKEISPGFQFGCVRGQEKEIIPGFQFGCVGGQEKEISPGFQFGCVGGQEKEIIPGFQFGCVRGQEKEIIPGFQFGCVGGQEKEIIPGFQFGCVGGQEKEIIPGFQFGCVRGQEKEIIPGFQFGCVGGQEKEIISGFQFGPGK
ncbi:hypothetical protein R3I94_016700 [Phoxinus phoxinus]